MAQAKTLSKSELKQVFDVTRACSRYAERDIIMLMLTHFYSLQIGEVAALKFEEIIKDDGTLLFEITPNKERTKSKRARKIFLAKKMMRKLCDYLSALTRRPAYGFYFQHRSRRTLAQIQPRNIYNAYMSAREYTVPQATQDAELG